MNILYILIYQPNYISLQRPQEAFETSNYGSENLTLPDGFSGMTMEPWADNLLLLDKGDER